MSCVPVTVTSLNIFHGFMVPSQHSRAEKINGMDRIFRGQAVSIPYTPALIAGC